MTKSLYDTRYQYVLGVLTTAREQSGLSQRKLSEKLGRTPSFVGKYENGNRRLDFGEVISIAVFLNIDIHKLVDKVLKM